MHLHFGFTERTVGQRVTRNIMLQNLRSTYLIFGDTSTARMQIVFLLYVFNGGVVTAFENIRVMCGLHVSLFDNNVPHNPPRSTGAGLTIVGSKYSYAPLRFPSSYSMQIRYIETLPYPFRRVHHILQIRGFRSWRS